MSGFHMFNLSCKSSQGRPQQQPGTPDGGDRGRKIKMEMSADRKMGGGRKEHGLGNEWGEGYDEGGKIYWKIMDTG